MGKTDQAIARWEKNGAVPEESDFLIRHIYRQTIIGERESDIEMVGRLKACPTSWRAKAVSVRCPGPGQGSSPIRGTATWTSGSRRRRGDGGWTTDEILVQALG